eukprot:CAMPEP_0182855180 /NCGR_PEP_ID=MMETSP0034_2-20130328/1694_1 /TAXON_ID=156128 /ORGANISM="Nephroselmis pyriformis, Strain CCMP717" /LENGTH=297 /DNA_ID=CAMNT_0024986113 /DNA_START=141 /DNA_END=1030 /DNA_ORIENTATION=-
MSASAAGPSDGAGAAGFGEAPDAGREAPSHDEQGRILSQSTGRPLKRGNIGWFRKRMKTIREAFGNMIYMLNPVRTKFGKEGVDGLNVFVWWASPYDIPEHFTNMELDDDTMDALRAWNKIITAFFVKKRAEQQLQAQAASVDNHQRQHSQGEEEAGGGRGATGPGPAADKNKLRKDLTEVLGKVPGATGPWLHKVPNATAAQSCGAGCTCRTQRPEWWPKDVPSVNPRHMSVKQQRLLYEAVIAVERQVEGVGLGTGMGAGAGVGVDRAGPAAEDVGAGAGAGVGVDRAGPAAEDV